MSRIDGLRRSYGCGEISNHFMQAWNLYPLLRSRGLMKCESVLSDEGGLTTINGVPIYVRPLIVSRAIARNRRRSFVQRVYAECDCGRPVPFGKLGQHRKACKASLR